MTDYEDILPGCGANSSYAKEGIYSLPIHSYSEVLYYNKTLPSTDWWFPPPGTIG